MGLRKDLFPGPVALDTCLFIYLIEENPRFLPLVRPLFEAIDARKIQAVTSALTLLETLALPYRRNDDKLAEKYERLFRGIPNLSVVDIDLPVLRLAAALRAKSHLKTPDALQLATAMRRQCRFFVTNDRRLPQFPRLTVLQLDDLV